MRHLLAFCSVFSSAALAADLPSLTRFQAEVREFNYFTGSPASFASICIEENCLSAVAGHTSYTRKQTVDAFSLSSIGSLSKYMTAILTLKLIEQGYLSLEDKLSQYFPQYPQWHEVTVRDLLAHSSGIPCYLFSPEGTKRTLLAVFDWHKKIWQPQDILKLFSQEPLEFSPGSKVVYNNSNYVLLGMILEQVTRRSLDALLEREIFAPLGMRDTYLTLPASQKHRRVSGFFPLEVPLPDWFFNLIAHKVEKSGIYLDTTDVFDPSLTWAAGAVVSTADDLSRLTKGLFTGRLLNDESLQAMQNFRLGSVLGMPFEYGLGLMRQPSAYGPLLGHGGLTPGYQALSNYLRERDQVITLMQNIAPAQTNSVYYELVDQIQSSFRDPVFELDPELDPDSLAPRTLHMRIRGKITAGNAPGSFFNPSFGFTKIRDTKSSEGLYQSFSSQWDESNQRLVLRATSSAIPLLGPSSSEDQGTPFIEIHLDREEILGQGLGNFSGDAANQVLSAYKGRMFRSEAGPKICLEQVSDLSRVSKFRIQGGAEAQLEPGQSLKFVGNIPLRSARSQDIPPAMTGWQICQK